jgi:hypothetical protein
MSYCRPEYLVELAARGASTVIESWSRPATSDVAEKA